MRKAGFAMNRKINNLTNEIVDNQNIQTHML